MRRNILVIRHGALGDVMLSTGAFAAIRAYHAGDRITLLTTPPYVTLLESSPYFDACVADDKPKFWQVGKLKNLVKFLREGDFTRVYDLQTSNRTTWYYRLLPSPKPECSGLARGASHRHHTPERTRLHTIDRQKQQLEIAGIHDVPPPDICWLKPTDFRFQVSDFCLLVPGGSAHRPEKRWPTERYGELAAWLCDRGIQPVLIGTEAERAALLRIQGAVAGRPGECSPNPSILNLCNRTSLADIAELARRATCAVGNDTGPMHLIAAAGCPSVVLFSSASNPDLCAPRGDHVTVLRRASLTDVSVKAVTDSIVRIR